MDQYGIFSGESVNYSEDEAVESGFYSLEEAAKKIMANYQAEDELFVHLIEEIDEDE